jgi:hypothetical protein
MEIDLIDNIILFCYLMSKYIIHLFKILLIILYIYLISYYQYPLLMYACCQVKIKIILI